MMHSRVVVVPLILISLVGSAVAGCSKKASNTNNAAVCTQVVIDTLSLSQKMTSAAFAHKPTPAELKDLDTALASLRGRLKTLTTDQRSKLSALLEAANTARQHLVDGQSVDAASVSLAQQALAKSCSLG